MKDYSGYELSTLNDEQIKKLFLEVRSKILQNLHASDEEKRELEIYYCYISREIESRNL